jgi:hypothetical protein
LLVAETGGEAFNGVYVIGSDGSIEQKRLTGEDAPQSIAIEKMYGDSIALFDDDNIAGFAPAGTSNGFVKIPGISTNVTNVELYRSYLTVAVSDGKTEVFEFVQNRENANLQLLNRTSIEFSPDLVVSSFNDSSIFFVIGTTLRKFDREIKTQSFLKDIGIVPLGVEQWEDERVLIFHNNSSIVVVDEITGNTLLTTSFGAFKLRFDRNNELLYLLQDNSDIEQRPISKVGSVVTIGSVVISINVPNAFLIDMQQTTGNVWAASRKKLFLLSGTDLSTIKEIGNWNSINDISAFRYPTEIKGESSFEHPRMMKLSPSWERILSTFNGSDKIVLIDDQDNGYSEFQLTGHTVFGGDIDEFSGDIRVSTIDQSINRSTVVTVNKFNNRIIDVSRIADSGDIEPVGDDNTLLRVNFEIETTNTGNISTFSGLFNSVSDSLDAQPLELFSTSNDDLLVKNDIAAAPANTSFPNKDISVDSWHFGNKGLVGSKVSVDKTLSFNDFETGVLRRAPLFSFEFSYLDLSDIIITSSDGDISTSIMSTSDDGATFSGVAALSGANFVTSLSSSGNNIFSAAEGYLTVFDHETLSAVNSTYVAEDLLVHFQREGFIWCSSPARGQIFRINSSNLSDVSVIDALDSPVELVYSDFLNMVVAAGENSISKIDPDTLDLEIFYDIEEHIVRDIYVKGDRLAVLLESDEDIPFAEDFDTDEEFEKVLIFRKRDRIILIDFNKFSFPLEFEAPTNFSSRNIVYDGTNVIVIGLTFDSKVDIKTSIIVRSEHEETGTIRSLESNEDIVGTIELVESEGFLSATVQGSAILFDDKNTSLVENAFASTTSNVAIGVPSSATNTESSDSEDSVSFDAVRIYVGDGEGLSNRWDSGEIETDKSNIIYGGGNNLEPGQEYFTSISVRRNGEWSLFSPSSFVMPHFENYTFLSNQSSSSCSSNIAGALLVGPGETLSVSLDSECLIIIFTGDAGQTATVIVNGKSYTVGNVSGKFVWDIGGIDEHSFDEIGEAALSSVDGTFFAIAFKGFGSSVFELIPGSLKENEEFEPAENFNSLSSSSSCSSSSCSSSSCSSSKSSSSCSSSSCSSSSCSSSSCSCSSSSCSSSESSSSCSSSSCSSSSCSSLSSSKSSSSCSSSSCSSCSCSSCSSSSSYSSYSDDGRVFYATVGNFVQTGGADIFADAYFSSSSSSSSFSSSSSSSESNSNSSSSSSSSSSSDSSSSFSSESSSSISGALLTDGSIVITFNSEAIIVESYYSSSSSCSCSSSSSSSE